MSLWTGPCDTRPRVAWQGRSAVAWRRHDIAVRGWAGPDLSIALISDLHACDPATPLTFVADLAQAVTDLTPDLIVLGGDFITRERPGMRPLPAADIVAALDPLQARLGVFASLGNHDWRDCALAKDTGMRTNSVIEAFHNSPHRLLVNEAVEVADLWIVGFDTQRVTRRAATARHDPDRAFTDVPKDAPALLLAHEPDYFAMGDDRAQVQLSGHTHGGQANLWGWRPLTPSRYGGRYAYGAHEDRDRHLIVSGGVGFSGLPLRFRQPGEVTLISLRGA